MAETQRVALGFLVSCCVFLSACSQNDHVAEVKQVPRSAEHPNVLLIVVDDLRCSLGSYGDTTAVSPNIDALCRRGMRFDRSYVQVAACNPSRVAMMTGLRPDTSGVWRLATPFRNNVPDVTTLPEHFMAHGYHTVGRGKVYHLKFPDPQSWSEPHRVSKTPIKYWTHQQWDFLEQVRERLRGAGHPDKIIKNLRPPTTCDADVPDHLRHEGAMTNAALTTLRRVAKQRQPFFMTVGYVNPHLPFNAPRKYWDLYDRDSLPEAKNPFLPDGAPRVAMNTMHELRYHCDFAEVPQPWEGELAEADRRRLVHGYLAAVSFVDAQVGRLMAEMNRLGLADNTIVVFWSDHGFKLGEHGSWGKKTNYEVDTRVPLIVVDPRNQTAGQSTSALVESVDLYPTLCELAGLPVPAHVEGTSFKPLLAKPNSPWKEAVFSQFLRDLVPEHGEVRGNAVRTGRYRYVTWRVHATDELLYEELYDHAGDPQENTNVIDQPGYKDALIRLRELQQQGWRSALPQSLRPNL
jgi:arylsulfatase A-like enzyme